MAAAKTKKDVKISEEPDRITHKVDATKIKKGHVMAFIDFVEITQINFGSTEVSVRNLGEGADSFQIKGRDLLVNSFSADIFEEEQKVTMTKAAEILIGSFNRPLTINFDKQDGENRTLRGRFIVSEPLLGRSKVEDLDIPKGQHRIRLVDHRTIRFLIVDGVKYVVK